MSFSRFVTRSSVNYVRAVQKIAVRQAMPSVRQMSSLIDAKEHAEESRYIRSVEAKRQEELKANMERILALEDSHEDKKDLLELLEKKDEPKTLLAKLGLNDWKFALPIGLFVGLPAIANELIIIDAELQLTACFILFCSTIYTQVGPMIGKALDDYSAELAADLKMADEAALAQVHAAIKENEKALSLNDDYQSLYQLTDSMAAAQAEALTLAEEHKYREAVVRKLDSLHALEEAASSAIRARMVNQVKADVVKTFTTDKKFKENALQQAISVLSAGAGGKMGKDLVGEAFASSIASYRAAYSKQSPDSDEILVQLQKDMAAVAQAPVVDAKGGNVFHTVL